MRPGGRAGPGAQAGQASAWGSAVEGPSPGVSHTEGAWRRRPPQDGEPVSSGPGAKSAAKLSSVSRGNRTKQTVNWAVLCRMPSVGGKMTAVRPGNVPVPVCPPFSRLERPSGYLMPECLSPGAWLSRRHVLSCNPAFLGQEWGLGQAGAVLAVTEAAWGSSRGW